MYMDGHKSKTKETVAPPPSKEKDMGEQSSVVELETEEAQPVTTEILPDADSESEEKDYETDKLDELTQQVNNFKNDLQRERAEFINYRKRVVQEKFEMEGSIMAKIVDTMLPALDAFDQLLSSFEENSEENLDNFLRGAELIQKQLIGAFQKYGVEEFNPKSDQFDPGSMEALHSQESDEVSTDMVSEVYQKGYKINGRLIRAARVSVLKPKKRTSEEKEKKNEE